MSLGGDLSMDLDRYGEYAPTARWESIRESLIHLEDRINISPSWSDYHSIYNSGYVSLSFWRSFSTPEFALSATDAAKVVKTTRDLFFVFKDNPRAFAAEIKLRQRSSMYYIVRWRPDLSAWPERLPFNFEGPRDPDLEIYLYGRDAEQEIVDQIYDSLRWFVNALHAEGPPTGFINEDSYSYNSVKLLIRAHRTAAGKSHITRRDMITVVDAAYELYKDNGPREFAAQLLGLHVILGKVFFLFTDLDDEGAVKSIERA